jgi:GH25 family lysozyme M1 (1,4-beta-N-acetylmuramidase)
MPCDGPASRWRGLVAVAALSAAGLTPLAVAAAPAAHAATASQVIDGPDVASYQHPNDARINWRKVARAHKDFAIVKSTEGTNYRNPWFTRDYDGARRAGLVRGSYHFARPAYPVIRTARHQAAYFAARLGSSPSRSRTLPPALDLEVTGGLDRGALVTWAQTFLLKLRRLTHRTPMLYTYPSFWDSALGDPAALARYPLWMASYSGGVDPAATLWQYTSGAHVDGIRGAVDMSRFLAEPDAWTTLSDGRVPTPWPASTPGAPQHVSAQPADSSATVSWLPGDTGSSDVLSYRVTATPGDATVSVGPTTLSATLPGLTNGTAYTFTVTATNRRGAGTASDPSQSVTPLVPTHFTVKPTVDVPYGGDATVVALLIRPDTGAVLAGRDVLVDERVAGATGWTSVGTMTTGPKGGVAVHVPQPAQDLDVRFRYVAPTGWKNAHAVVPVLVHQLVTARLSTTRVRAGRPVTLSGRVTPAVAGVTVRREGFYAHAWHLWQTAVTTADGRYVFAFTPTAKTVDRYRVVAVGHDGLAVGISRTRRLDVR